MELPVLKVEAREKLGKGMAGKLRRRGMVPGVCYGKGRNNLSLFFQPEQLLPLIKGSRGRNTLIKLEGLSEERTVFVQDVQIHPVTRKWVHVDFLHVDPGQPVVRPVPVNFTGRAEGVKAGGVLQVIRRHIMIECLPSQVPEKIDLDVTPLQIGQSVHVKEVKLPEGMRAVFDTNFTICTVVAPTEEKAPVAAEGAPAEGEAAAAPAEGEAAKEAAPADAAAKDAKDAKAAKADKGQPAKAEKKG